MNTHANGLAPVEGPMIRLWYFAPVLLLVVVFATLGAIVAVETIPMPARVASALAVWGGPLLLSLALQPWMRRLDEFQTSLILQAMAQAGGVTLSLVVALSFYFLLSGSSGPQGSYIVIGEAPALYLLMLALHIAYGERAASRRARRAAGRE